MFWLRRRFSGPLKTNESQCCLCAFELIVYALLQIQEINLPPCRASIKKAKHEIFKTFFITVINLDASFICQVTAFTNLFSFLHINGLLLMPFE